MLGTLEQMPLRDVWEDEAHDFTPWLARDENLTLLGKAIGIELELDSIETNVGSFNADILCHDTLNDSWVLIENQLACPRMSSSSPSFRAEARNLFGQAEQDRT